MADGSGRGGTALDALGWLDAARIMARCDELAALSETPEGLTRTFLGPRMREASELVKGWMRDAGMAVREDTIGNVIGRREGDRPGLPCLLMGSHLDSVRNAGKYDGPLGVVTAIEIAAALNAVDARLPFAFEVVGFGDEEGTRFQTTLISSKALAGTLDTAVLAVKDATGVSIADALTSFGLDPARVAESARKPEEILAYLEFHIEQGPVLEREELAVGVVTAIVGATRFQVSIKGMAGHAGTVPMTGRRDALAAAAECVLAIERIGRRRAGDQVVATVGQLTALPGAANVIPGLARFTIDVRAALDHDRHATVAEIQEACDGIAAFRGVEIVWTGTHDAGSVDCAPALMDRLDAAMIQEGQPPRRLPSGAGHDAMVMAKVTPTAMLFCRCRGGISHNPLEAVMVEDVATSARVLLRFIADFPGA